MVADILSQITGLLSTRRLGGMTCGPSSQETQYLPYPTLIYYLTLPEGSQTTHFCGHVIHDTSLPSPILPSLCFHCGTNLSFFPRLSFSLTGSITTVLLAGRMSSRQTEPTAIPPMLAPSSAAELGHTSLPQEENICPHTTGPKGSNRQPSTCVTRHSEYTLSFPAAPGYQIARIPNSEVGARNPSNLFAVGCE